MIVSDSFGLGLFRVSCEQSTNCATCFGRNLRIVGDGICVLAVQQCWFSVVSILSNSILFCEHLGKTVAFTASISYILGCYGRARSGGWRQPAAGNPRFITYQYVFFLVRVWFYSKRILWVPHALTQAPMPYHRPCVPTENWQTYQSSQHRSPSTLCKILVPVHSSQNYYSTRPNPSSSSSRHRGIPN